MQKTAEPLQNPTINHFRSHRANRDDQNILIKRKHLNKIRKEGKKENSEKQESRQIQDFVPLSAKKQKTNKNEPKTHLFLLFMKRRRGNRKEKQLNKTKNWSR